MTVKTNCSRLDYLYYQFYLLPRSKGTWIVGFIIWIIMFLATLYGLEFTGDAVCRICTLLSAFIVSAFYATFTWLGLLLLGLIVSTLSVKPEQGVLGEHEFVLKEDGLFEKTIVNETLTKWPGISSIKKTKRYIIIRIGNFFFHILPKTSFPSVEEYNKFWDYLSEHWSAVKRK